MGHPDPDVMAEHMSARLLTEWMGFYRLRDARRKAAAKKGGRL